MGYVRRVEIPHYCQPPDPFGQPGDWEELELGGAPRLKAGRRLPQLGDIWECDDCGTRWTLEPPHHPYDMVPEWHEKRRPWWRRRPQR